MTQDEFDQSVINTANSFGNNPGIEYNALTVGQTSGNCNTSTTTILSKVGVSTEKISKIEKQLSGLNWGFGDVKPWTKEEQAAAIKAENEQAEKESRSYDLEWKFNLFK